MTTKCAWFVAVILGIMAVPADAADWPQWRGPHRDGVSSETGLLQEWPKQGPKLLWQVNNIGFGYSTPSVVGDRLYLLSNEGTQDEFVRALSTADGRHIWSTRIGKVGNPDQNPSFPGARSTPTVDGNLLYALGSDGDLACLEASGGKLLWTKNIRTEFGGRPGDWAFAESPLVDGNVLVCAPGGSDAALVALEKSTGNVIWRAAVPDGGAAAYSSTVAADVAGSRQYVQFLHNALVGVEAGTGKLLWRYSGTAENSPANIATPVVHEGQVYSGTSMGKGALVNVVAGQEPQEVYGSKRLPTGGGGAVRVGDYLYGSQGPTLVCVDFKTGQMKWQNRSTGASSFCYADGCLYVHGESTGEVALVEATPDGYREKGRFTPPNQPDRGTSQAWAYPVVANGRLYIRDLGTLWCFDVRRQ
jgi:outer membrane protein assembly factor BamB